MIAQDICQVLGTQVVRLNAAYSLLATQQHDDREAGARIAESLRLAASSPASRTTPAPQAAAAASAPAEARRTGSA
ncbi:hypothetical protein ACWGCW_32150 [Streptomyces sp. NPDC054933]